MEYANEASLLDARSRYYRENGFDDDGGDSRSFVRVEFGPLPLYFPNSDARRRAVRYHDVHHVLTGYDTDWAGEAEIGAWEVASGCRGHLAAWHLNLSVMWVGLFVAPLRTWRAFLRGRRTRNLYGEDWESVRLEEPVGLHRRRLGLDAESIAARPGDRRAFAGFVGAAAVAAALNALLILAPLALLYALFF